MPEVDLTVQTISAWAMLLAGGAWGIWRAVEWLRARTADAGEGGQVVTEKLCNAKHAATEAQIGHLSVRVDELKDDVKKLSGAVEDLTGAVGNLNALLQRLVGAQEERRALEGGKVSKRRS
jgi:hypothetical protein